jgi:hypothetical protein
MNTFSKKILLALALTLLFSTTASANEHDSLHLYNALENHSTIDQMLTTHAIEEAQLTETETASLIKRTAKKEMTQAEVLEALEEITAKQELAIEKAQNAMNSVKNKSGLRATVLGNNLGTLEFQLVQIKGLQALLNSLISKTVDVPLKLQMKDQIETLKQEQEKIEILLDEKEGKFSFLGWLVATL